MNSRASKSTGMQSNSTASARCSTQAREQQVHDKLCWSTPPLGVKVERGFQLINNESGHGKARYRDLVNITRTLRKLLDSSQRVEDAARLGTADAGSTSAGSNRISKRANSALSPNRHVRSPRSESSTSNLASPIGVKALSREFISFGSTVSWLQMRRNGVADSVVDNNFLLRG